MKKRRILLVDDSIEWLNHHLNLFEQLFQPNSFEIETAMSAKEGFNKAVSVNNPYSLIITDLEMEDVQALGLEFSYAGEWLLNVLKNKITSKFLIISGSYDISDIAKKFDVDFVPKDFLFNNPNLLKYKVEELIKNY